MSEVGMTKQDKQLQKLRERAEQLVEQKMDKLHLLDQAEILHELKVYQIELEMQNEELRQAQEKLSDMLDRYTDLYNNAPVGYITLNKAGMLVEVNETFASMCAVPQLEMRNRYLTQFLTPESELIFRQRFSAFRKVPGNKTLELKLTTEANAIIAIEIKGRRLEQKDASNHILLACSVIDVTERNEALKEKERLEVQLRQKCKMEAVGVMAGGIAHNFNNNLAIILGNLELSQMKAHPHSGISQHLDSAKIAVHRSRDLIRKILTYSRQWSFSEKAVNLHDALKEVISLMQNTIPSSVLVRQVIPERLNHVMIASDPSQIQEVIINIVNNAVQAMNGQGELTISLEVVEFTSRGFPATQKVEPGEYALIKVTDNGEGMTKEVLEKIFDPFFTTKDVNEGTGMGLSSVLGIMEQHSGFINVSSEVASGSTFELYFPILKADENIDEEQSADVFIRGSGNILFLDDEKELGHIANQILSVLGYSVTAFTDANRALDAFRQDPASFDVVISDQTMPEMLGLDFLTEILKIRSDTATILCTGYNSNIDEKSVAKAGINAYFMKPLDWKAASQKIQELISR